MTNSIQVVIDCADPDRVAAFWADALGYIVQPPPEGYADWDAFLKAHGWEDRAGTASAIIDPEGKRPRVYFQRVPESKTVKNRVHLDLNQGTRDTPGEERRRLVDAEVERLRGLGATELYRSNQDGEYFVTMADPEGNEFCVQ